LRAAAIARSAAETVEDPAGGGLVGEGSNGGNAGAWNGIGGG
jgi:hypothetical protein